MPCYDSRNDPDYVRGEERIQAFKDFTHNSPLAEMFCYVMTHYHVNADGMPPEIKQWWKEHQARDASRSKTNGKSRRR